MAAKKDERVRNWTFILYPESAPEKWFEILADLHTPFAVSPLHDRDVNPDGEQKKPHYHILFTFAGNKSFEQIEKITKSVNAPIPQKVGNVKGMVRYFAHLDNPEKAQYDIREVKGYCGLDISDTLKPTTTEKHIILKDIIRYVRTNNIMYYGDLIDYCLNYQEDWFSVLVEGYTYVIDSVIKSNRAKYIDVREEKKKNAVTD